MSSVKRWRCSDAAGMQEKEKGGWVLYIDHEKAVQEAYAEAYENGKKEGYEEGLLRGQRQGHEYALQAEREAY